MSSILTQSTGEVRDRLTVAITDIAANQGSSAVRSVVEMLDAVLDLYAVESIDAAPAKLPEFQVAIKQVRAIRHSLAQPGDKKPTIF